MQPTAAFENEQTRRSKKKKKSKACKCNRTKHLHPSDLRARVRRALCERKSLFVRVDLYECLLLILSLRLARESPCSFQTRHYRVHLARCRVG